MGQLVGLFSKLYSKHKSTVNARCNFFSS